MDLNISEGSATFQFNKYLFNSRVQEVNETIEDFVKDLIRLGSSINAQESQIVDRFIAGKFWNKQETMDFLLFTSFKNFPFVNEIKEKLLFYRFK